MAWKIREAYRRCPDGAWAYSPRLAQLRLPWVCNRQLRLTAMRLRQVPRTFPGDRSKTGAVLAAPVHYATTALRLAVSFLHSQGRRYRANLGLKADAPSGHPPDATIERGRPKTLRMWTLAVYFGRLWIGELRRNKPDRSGEDLSRKKAQAASLSVNRPARSARLRRLRSSSNVSAML
jgi:hypothetical protein